MISEDNLKHAIQQLYASGVEIEKARLLVGSQARTVVDQFKGIATRYRAVPKDDPPQIVPAADVYISHYGILYVIPISDIDPEAVFIEYTLNGETKGLAVTESDLVSLQIKNVQLPHARKFRAAAELKGMKHAELFGEMVDQIDLDGNKGEK